jgi:NAD(P)-dependent dehydrogenase (short-subunit alcohol dehydrogenase family)
MTAALTGSRVLVTGATQNIGRGIADAFAAAGAHVAILARDGHRATEVAEELKAKYAVPTIGVSADVRDEAAVNAAMVQVTDAFGGLDVVVNNAGHTLYKSVEGQTLAEWDFIMDVSVKGSLLCIRAALPHLKASGNGVILFTSGINTVRALDMYSAATASRGALNALTVQLSCELAPWNIRVNTVQLGPTGTPTGSNDMEGRTEEYDYIPLRRIGRPDDVGSAMVFLASPKASYITGIVLPVDGGLSAAIPGYNNQPHAEAVS